MAPSPGRGSDGPEYRKMRESFGLEPSDTREKTLDLLVNVIRRAKALRKPRSVPCSIDTTFCLENAPYDIAMLSVPVCIRRPNGETIPSVPPTQDNVFFLKQKEFDHFQLCVRDTTANIELLEGWCDYIKGECNRLLTAPRAGENGVKFLIINELGFPNFWIGQLDGLAQGRLRQRLNALNHDLSSRLQTLANERQAVIIAGSAHDPSTFQNWGPIFFPEAKRSIDHKKLTSAYKIGEYIKTAVGADYPVYSVGNLTFSVLICSDAFDLNIFFEPFASAPATSRLVPNIVFVPSFYEQELKPARMHALREACRQLSLASNVIVVFCNHGLDSQRHAVFLGGAALDLRTDAMTSQVTIDAARLSVIRDNARPIWDEMNSIFRKPKTLWPQSS